MHLNAFVTQSQIRGKESHVNAESMFQAFNRGMVRTLLRAKEERHVKYTDAIVYRHKGVRMILARLQKGRKGLWSFVVCKKGAVPRE